MPGCSSPADPAYGTTNYQSFWVLLPDDFPVARDAVMLRAARPGHLQPPRHHGRAPGAGLRRPSPPELPVTERLTAGSLILPLFHGMEADQVERVAQALARCVQGVPTWR